MRVPPSTHGFDGTKACRLFLPFNGERQLYVAEAEAPAMTFLRLEPNLLESEVFSQHLVPGCLLLVGE
jgi:hypothetical protein